MIAHEEPVEVTAADARRRSRFELNALLHDLVAEFRGHVPAGVVIAETVRSRELLLASGLRSGLVPATESMARTRLRALHDQDAPTASP